MNPRIIERILQLITYLFVLVCRQAHSVLGQMQTFEHGESSNRKHRCISALPLQILGKLNMLVLVQEMKASTLTILQRPDEESEAKYHT